ncbi:MAG: hypothetical protein DI538_31510 [Azospira oryzae]|nr:MAG: hypothetical protein DI538_31510 [Azospira oryzae]
MAVAPGHALLNVGTTDGMDVLVAETAHGEIVMSQTADDTARILAGVVADVRQYLRAPRPALTVDVREFGVKANAGNGLAYVRVPFAAREQVLALKPEIVQELVEGDGLWQAVVAVDDIASIKVSAHGGMVMPLNGAWQAPVSGHAFGGLRLVG